MALNMGQLLGGAGIVANRQREAETAMLNQRETLMRVQEANRLQEIRARMGEGATEAASAPFPEFVQSPGTVIGNPNAAPAAQPATRPVAQPSNGAPVAAPAAAPAAPTPTPAPASGLRLPASMTAPKPTLAPQEEVRQITSDLAAAQQRLAGLNGPWYLPTPQGNAGEIARTKAEIARLEKLKQERVIPALQAEYQRVNPQYKYPQDVAAQEARQVAEANIKAAPQTFAKLEQKYGLPTGLLNAVMMAESGGSPDLTSRAGAQGYFQFMPETAKQYKVKVNDLNSEADGAARLLRDLLKSSNGDLQTALAAYNWGIGNVQRQGMGNMPAETRNYIPKVLSLMNGKQAPAAATQTVTQAVASGTPADVATAASNAVPVQPSKDGTMYGPAQLDASARNPQIQQILTTRAALQKQVALFNQYGMGDKAWEAVSKIQALDLGLYKNQADIGVYEGATTGNFSRAMSVLSTFTGAPHQVMRRPDGNFDLYINGKVARAGLDGAQVEQLVRTQVDSEYRQQLARLQTERGQERFKTDEKIREKTSEEVLRTAREVQLKLIEGNIKVAEEKIKQGGFKLIGSGAGDGKAYYSNGMGDVFVIDGQNKTMTINGATVDVGVNAQRVSGVDRSIWSSVNAPQQQAR
jgi:soluble lytic murein transglycosylase-like protein